jgi:tether containing UBX domain for GLUT4
VRHVMAHREQKFRLVLPGGKVVIKDSDDAGNALIRTYRLSTRTLVNLVWDDAVPADVRKQPFMSSSVARQGQAIEVPKVPEVVEEKASNSTPNPQPAEKDESKEGGGGKKLPKWFKGLGKK